MLIYEINFDDISLVQSYIILHGPFLLRQKFIVLSCKNVFFIEYPNFIKVHQKLSAAKVRLI